MTNGTEASEPDWVYQRPLTAALTSSHDCSTACSSPARPTSSRAKPMKKSTKSTDCTISANERQNSASNSRLSSRPRFQFLWRKSAHASFAPHLTCPLSFPSIVMYGLSPVMVTKERTSPPSLPNSSSPVCWLDAQKAVCALICSPDQEP
jgi:hypothetical protein